MILNSLIVSMYRHNAERLHRVAAWDRGHMHESGTTQEWECRRDNNEARDREARVWDFAADHLKAMNPREF